MYTVSLQGLSLELTFGTDVESYHNPEEKRDSTEWMDLNSAI